MIYISYHIMIYPLILSMYCFTRGSLLVFRTLIQCLHAIKKIKGYFAAVREFIRVEIMMWISLYYFLYASSPTVYDSLNQSLSPQEASNIKFIWDLYSQILNNLDIYIYMYIYIYLYIHITKRQVLQWLQETFTMIMQTYPNFVTSQCDQA